LVLNHSPPTTSQHHNITHSISKGIYGDSVRTRKRKGIPSLRISCNSWNAFGSYGTNSHRFSNSTRSFCYSSPIACLMPALALSYSIARSSESPRMQRRRRYRCGPSLNLTRNSSAIPSLGLVGQRPRQRQWFYLI